MVKENNKGKDVYNKYEELELVNYYLYYHHLFDELLLVKLLPLGDLNRPVSIKGM